MRSAAPSGSLPLAIGLAVVVACATSGCSKAAIERGPLYGKVTVDGVPVATGQIRFFALSAEGIGTDATITDGKYTVPADRGLAAGNYRVEIVSLKPTGKRIMDTDSNQLVDEVVNLLPPRYNTQSTLQISYDPAASKSHDFELTSK